MQKKATFLSHPQKDLYMGNGNSNKPALRKFMKGGAEMSTNEGPPTQREPISITGNVSTMKFPDVMLIANMVDAKNSQGGRGFDVAAGSSFPEK